jgi:hypothetical protein
MRRSLSRSDKQNREATEIIKNIKLLKVSPYALMKLDLMRAYGRLEVKNIIILRDISRTLSYYDIEVVKPDPEHLTKKRKLREKSLTYFDNL